MANAVLTVLEADGSTETDVTVLDVGRQAAAASKSLALATEDKAVLDALAASVAGVTEGSTTSGQTLSLVGGAAQSAEATALSTGQSGSLAMTLVKKLINMPYANPESTLNGTTAALTTTTSTQIVAAQATGIRIYVTDLLVTNSHASVATFVTIRDGDGGTILWEGYAAAAGGGFAKSFLVPLRGTAATRLDVKCETSGANVIASVSGFKGV